jgi:parvulin-like peptidyl-prolyl isomerase
MKSLKFAALAALLTVPLAAQQAPAAAPAAAEDPGQKAVATVNGEVITRARLDALYERLGAQMRGQYENSGGKVAFLDNYVKKRLMIQEAMKSGFDQKPAVKQELEAARESALFDLYVRDVVAAQHVTDAAARKFYDENRDQFKYAEKVKVRHIVIGVSEVGPKPKTREQARAAITALFAELRQSAPRPGASATEIQAFLNKFGQVARQHSEDATAQEGGLLGWVEKGTLDPSFGEAAFNVQKSTLSGVVESGFGFHLIFIEDKLPAGHETFEQVRSSIREFLMAQNAAAVMETVGRVTNELRANSRVAMYPENLK